MVVFPFVPVTPAISSSFVGSPKKRSARDRHRLAHGRHDELRDIDLERPLDDDGGSTALDRLPGEVVAVDALAGDAEEECAGGHAPGVVREVGDLDGPPTNHLARRESLNQGVERHSSEG